MHLVAAAAILAVPLWAQTRLPAGMTETPRAPREVDTRQIGGIVSGRLIMDLRTSRLGVLRCPAGQAFTGTIHRFGSALDNLSIVCAPVRCAGSACSWSGGRVGGTAGTSQGGIVTVRQTCRADSAVSGIRAATNFAGAYALDFDLECAPMTGRPPSSFTAGFTIVPVRTTARYYASRYDHTSGTTLAPADRPSSTAACRDSAATALSFAMGRYGAQQIPVVQAISLYCANDADSSGDPELRSLAEQLRRDSVRLKGMADVAVDHFYFHLIDSQISTLEHMARNPENGLGVNGQTILAFLTDPGLALRAAAEGIQTFVTDPAKFLGENATALFSRRPGGESLGAVAKKAAFRLRALNAIRGDFGTMGFTLRPSKFNPSGSLTNCFACSLAYDKTRASRRMWTAPDTPILQEDSIEIALRARFGHRDFGPDAVHGADAALHQRLGIPMPTSRERIEALIRHVGADARGIVFVREGLADGHIFNVHHHEGRVVFFDSQIGAFARFPPNAKVYFYRTN